MRGGYTSGHLVSFPYNSIDLPAAQAYYPHWTTTVQPAPVVVTN